MCVSVLSFSEEELPASNAMEEKVSTMIPLHLDIIIITLLNNNDDDVYEAHLQSPFNHKKRKLSKISANMSFCRPDLISLAIMHSITQPMLIMHDYCFTNTFLNVLVNPL